MRPQPSRDNDDDQIDRTLSSPQKRFQERFQGKLSAEAMLARVIEAEKESLEQTFNDFSQTDQIHRAVALILGARRRFISGVGQSAAYAGLLGNELLLTISNVFVVDGRELTPLIVLTDVRASDVLIVFQRRRYRNETIRFGQCFKAAGGQLIVVADREDAPLADQASALIRVHTTSASYADSPTSMAATCHLLSALVSASAKGAKRRLAANEKAAGDLDLFYEWPPDPEPSGAPPRNL